MTLVSGFNHVAQSTQDLDRLAAFYCDAMDVVFEPGPKDPRARHGYLHIGPTVLHVFEVPVEITDYGTPDAMFRRGRLDHLAIEAPDETALRTIRERLLATGATDGVLTVYENTLLSLHVQDPDGMHLEVTCTWTGEVFGDNDVVRFVH